MVWFNRIVSLAGLLGFGALLLTILFAPAKVEQTARAFVVSEVRQTLAPVLESKAGQKLQSALKNWQAKRDKGEDGEMASGVAKRLAPIVQKLCHFTCADRAALEAKIAEDLNKAVSAAEKARAKLVAAAQAKFQSVVTKIRRDFLIFAGSNLAIFTLLFSTTFLGPRAQRALVLPSLLLIVSTAICAGIYLFGQNWFHTILFDDYLGFGYLLMVAVFTLFFLCVIHARRNPPSAGHVAAEVVAAPVQVAGAAGAAAAEGALAGVTGAVVVCAEAVVGALLLVIPS